MGRGMSIRLRFDCVTDEREVGLRELSERVGIAPASLSRIETGGIRAIRFSTPSGLCEVLGCQPGDLLEYITDGKDEGGR